MYIVLLITQISNNRRASAVRLGLHSQIMDDVRLPLAQLEEMAHTLDDEGFMAVERTVHFQVKVVATDIFLLSRSLSLAQGRFCQRSHD